MPRVISILRRAAAILFAALAATAPVSAQLDETCIVSVVNRSARVAPDGSWVLGNVPSTFGQLRVRANCLAEGVTRAGQSEFFAPVADEGVRAPEIVFDAPQPIAATLTLSAPTVQLGAAGETVQLAVTGNLADGSTLDLTSGASGTDYRTSNPAIAAVSADGLVTAATSGTVLISAVNEGALGVLPIMVLLSGDSDGDGLPDDFEIANGLDPNDPVDALLDPDGDGLSTIDEFLAGLDPFDADTDDDGLTDGEEVNVFGTNPLLFDTDGDFFSDGLEIATGSDPLDPDSFNLAAALQSLSVSPSAFVIVFNTILGEASRQLVVTGTLIDGTLIDITDSARYGTNYSSSDLLVANFGIEPGRVFAGQDGTATVTAENSGFSADADVQVQSFSPVALGSIPVPGFANSVEALGDHAYIAAGAEGLQVVDVSDPEAPFIAAALPLAGNANDVRTAPGLAYVAAGSAGLHVVDVSDPTAPALLGSVATPGVATDIFVVGTRVFVADEVGLRVIDASDPLTPVLLGGVDTPGRARGVAVAGDLAVVAASQEGVHIVDVSDPAAPTVVGTTHTRPGSISRAASVAVRGSLAYVADGSSNLGGLRVIDFGVPSTPVVVGASTDIFALVDVDLDGSLALTADRAFVNGVPVFDVAGADPVFNALIDFAPISGRDDNGNGVDARDGFVYMVGTIGRFLDNGVNGNSALHIGRYVIAADDEGIPPTVEIVAPEDGSSVLERRTLRLEAEASDDVRVEAVQFLVDGEPVGTDFGAPYAIDVVAPAEVPSFRVGAIAFDGGGNSAFAEEVTVQVLPDSDPVVRILFPLVGSSFPEGSVIPFAASASDDIRVASVDFLVDGAVVDTVFAPPYRTEITLPTGVPQVTLEAVAVDEFGQTGRSGPRDVLLTADEPPTVVILEPQDGTVVVSGIVTTVRVGALDDIGVAAVRLFVDGALEGEDLDEPYEFDLTIPSGPLQIRLTAEAEDTLGAIAVSDEVVLLISDEDPLTEVVGTVFDTAGDPQEGATVTCRGVSGTSGPDGSFAIPGVPTRFGNIRCSARFVDPLGAVFAGLSEPAPPVAGGITDVGRIDLAPFTGLLYPNGKVAVGSTPKGLEVDDFNGDALLDIVAVNNDGGDISVLLGKSDGSFEEQVFYEIRPGSESEGIALDDFDRDGALDVATANVSDDDVTIFLGNGDGTFQTPPLSVPAGNGTREVVTGDLDGDDIPDLVAVNSFADDVHVFLGNGDGSFLFSQLIPVENSPRWAELADLDLDGELDLVVAHFLSSLVGIYLGNGDGTFTFERNYPSGGRGDGLGVGDLNEDGIPDLAVGSSDSGGINIHVGTGDGDFVFVSTLPGTPDEVELGDVDNDGLLDVIGLRTGARVHINMGGALFEAPFELTTGSGPRDGVVVDIDFDEINDILVANQFSDDVSLIYGLGDGDFESDVRLPLLGGPHSVAVEDMEPDGTLDLVVALEDDDQVAVVPGRGDGTFRAETRYPVGGVPLFVITADLDGNGQPDAISANTATDDVSVLLGDGAGALLPETRFPVGLCPESLAAADVNGDTRVDLAVGNTCDDDVSVLLGNGDGTFQPQMRFPTGFTPTGVAIADLDEDGAPDLVTANNGASDISILFGNGDGTFQPHQLLPVGGQPVSVVIDDFDGDDNLDIAAANNLFNLGISILLGNGDGTFEPEARYPANTFPWLIVARDVNGDDLPDLIVTDAFLDDMAVLLGNGDGTFFAPQIFSTGECPYGLAVADLNGNGLQDVVTANYCSDDLSLLFHR